MISSVSLPARTSGEIFLDELRAEMYIDLNKRCVSDATEAVDLTGLHDEDVAGAGFELLAVDVPEASALAHDLDFIIWMAMRAGTPAGKGAEEKDRDIDVAVVGADEAVRTPLKGKILLTDAVHPDGAPGRGFG
jgi:hypothetical protein